LRTLSSDQKANKKQMTRKQMGTKIKSKSNQTHAVGRSWAAAGEAKQQGRESGTGAVPGSRAVKVKVKVNVKSNFGAKRTAGRRRRGV
jgi:hypothetical protein